MDNSLVENNARMFATVTNEAHMMLPLLTQTFKLRIKSGGKNPLAWSTFPQEEVCLLGKWIDVVVVWEGTTFFTLREVKTRRLLQFCKEEFFAHVTQKGVAPKMFKTWELANKAK